MTQYMLIDMDAFFISCETATRPNLNSKPVAVCTGTQRGGVIASASYKAREYGIKSGMPSYLAKQLYPSLICIPANMNKYAYISQEIMGYLSALTPSFEVSSIDEAYMDITYLKGDILLFAHKIQKAIRNRFKISASIGIGPSKIIAKIICRRVKPHGIGIMDTNTAKEFMKGVNIENIPSIGEKSVRILKRHAITTGRDLQTANEDLLIKLFGIRGTWFKKMSLGFDAGHFAMHNAEIKSIGHSETLPRNTASRDIIKSYILILALKVSIRAKRLRKMGKTIGLTLRFANFKTIKRCKALNDYVYTYYDVYRQALYIYDSLKNTKAVRLVGVTLSDLVPLRNMPGFFFNNDQMLFEALFEIYQKYGDFSVMPAAVLNLKKETEVIPPRII